MSRKILVAGNWKMHGSLDMCKALVPALNDRVSTMDNVDVAICPPYPYLPAARELASSGIALGAQDVCSTEGTGAHTGEVSGEMLKELGCHYVLVGHSERRAMYGDSDSVVAEKFAAAQAAGLVPVLCVGETLEERESDQTEAVLARQLDAVIAHCGIKALAESVLAYEPVWAIGTGKTASPEQAQAAHAFLRGRIADEDAIIAADLRMLYGGSVKPDNAATLFACEDVDGGLIGGASLDAGQFGDICAAGNQA